MIISIDFDGVMHSYDSGWQGADQIPDPPVIGAIEWFTSLFSHPDIVVAVYSSRNHQNGGVDAMKAWLRKYGVEQSMIDKTQFPLVKPPAHVHLDDRALTFEGTFPDVEFLKSFKPWNRRGDNTSPHE